MINIVKFIKDIPRQWKAETPKIYRWIRNIAGIITASVPTVYGSLSMMRVTGYMPEWFNSSVGYITFIAGMITIAAGTKEVNPVKPYTNNRHGRP